ncbi:MAG TPA: PHP domain-containing protein, partial [Anaerolineae bacterium]|nr:PHP domain-containing protein [Anaerolineae bacterium]
LKVDLHLHTCVSKDGLLHPAAMIRRAKSKGLDRICITDHNSIIGAQAAQQIDPDYVLVGEEILTAEGHELLAFFVSKWVPPRLPYREALSRLEAQGAVISVSHPFDRHRNQPWSEAILESILPRLDAIEGFNARAVHAADNDRALTFAAKHGLPVTAGSDAHIGAEIGAAYLELPAFTSAAEFRAALPQAQIRGNLSPLWVHFFSVLNKWRGKVGLKPSLGGRA